jgi:hypothetical protein
LCVQNLKWLTVYLTMLSVSRLYCGDDWMINACGAVGGMTIGGEQ